MPLVTEQIVAEDIHGETGLDGPYLPPAEFELDPRSAAQFIVDTVMAHEPNSVSLVPVGPFTNIALAMRLEPRIVDRVKSVVVMGGAYTRGNVTPGAEFNIYVDPEAAEAVFRAPWNVTMMGLDLTHQALATAELQERVRAVGGPISVSCWISGSSWAAPTGSSTNSTRRPCMMPAASQPSSIPVRSRLPRRTCASNYGESGRGGMTVVNFLDAPGMHHSNGTALAQTDYRTHVATALEWERFADQVVDAVERLTVALG